jgi:hypothetical protein
MDLIKVLEGWNVNWLYLTIAVFILFVILTAQLGFCLIRTGGRRKKLITEMQLFVMETEQEKEKRQQVNALLLESLTAQEKVFAAIEDEITRLQKAGGKIRTINVPNTTKPDVSDFFKKMEMVSCKSNTGNDEHNEKAKQIDLLVKSIEKLSYQASVLSVGASIEIAKADTQHRGFAIVIDELKKLVESMTSYVYDLGIVSRELVSDSRNDRTPLVFPEQLKSEIAASFDKNTRLIQEMKNAMDEQTHIYKDAQDNYARILVLKSESAKISEKLKALEK